MAKQDYIIGLDLGIASVGWACVKVAIHTDKDGKEQAQPIGLIDCGVRCFAAAEVPKTGESLNAARRAARSQRRTIARRANRMRQVRKLLFKHGLLTANEFQAAYCQNPKHKKDKDTTLIKERNEKLLKKIGIPEQQLLSGSLKDGEEAFFSNVWQLRVKALQCKLERAEFAAVICHLVKHRGYLSTRKSERKDADGTLLSGLDSSDGYLGKEPKNLPFKQIGEFAVFENNQFIRDFTETEKNTLLQEETDKKAYIETQKAKSLLSIPESVQIIRKKTYKTPAEVAVYTFTNADGKPQYRNKQILAYEKDSKGEYKKDENGNKIPIYKKKNGKYELDENGNKIQDKEGSYLHSFMRINLENELRLIFEKQKEFGNVYATPDLCGQLCHILIYQKPALQGDALKKMWGKCSVYENEDRSPKYCYTAERFVWISKLNNLKINNKPLTEEQRLLLKELPFEQSKLTFTQVRKKLGLADNATFNLCRYVYDKDKTAEQNLADSEKATLFEAKFFHDLRKKYAENGLENEWEALKNNPAKLDQIGEVLAFYKEDKDRKQHLSDFSNEEIEAILELNFDKSLNLSLKAIGEILPLMENGLRYDEACTKIYGNHYGRSKDKQAHDKLPIIDKKDPDTPNNPVVYRTITQARKIINAIIAQYGQPFRVHIEMGRDLGKSRDERNKIEKQNKDNQAERERASNDFEELFGFKPKGKDILLKRLYDNQHGKCLYSGKPIDLERIFEKGYVEIDHAIPFSRSWDDSQNNKVLVLGAENQNKGNKTPFEWLGHDEQKWRDFETRVNSCRFSLRKKQNILRRELEEGFIERNINDTRYVTRFLKNYIENNLAFSGSLKYTDKQGTEHNYKKVFAPQGQITSLLRNSWGFAKVREDNDRHHALDAIVVACATPAMQQKLTAYYQWYERRYKKDEWSKEEWEKFTTLLQRKQEKVDTETGEVKYLFPVPWGFPEWFNTEINLRVFNQLPKRDENGDIVRVENKIQYEPLNNPYQKEELLDALAKHLPNCPQAIHDNVTPLFVSRMVSKDRFGRVHKDGLDKEKEVSNKDSKFKVRGGYSEYASPVRIDIFKDDKGNNYFVPIYVNLADQKLPASLLPIPQKKDRKGNIIPTEFYFSLYPYDLVEIEDDGVKEFAYYLWISATNGQTCFKTPDGSSKRKGTGKTDEKGEFKKMILGLKLKKYKVDILGKHLTEIEKEQRQGFDKLSDNDD